MNLIIFATTSGATEAVATALAELTGARNTRMANLRKDELRADAPFDWVFAGTPSYGRGDWHHAWMRRSTETIGILRSARRVCLFGLGDSVHHAETFAGGIGQLDRFCREIGVATLGALAETRRSGPSVNSGYLPGLVIEYARERRRLEGMLVGWLEAIGFDRRSSERPDGSGAVALTRP